MIGRLVHWRSGGRFGLGGAIIGLAIGLPLAIADWLGDDSVVQGSCTALGGLAAVAYGVGRIHWFHPAANLTYGLWLLSTPWKWPQPLPFGSPLLCLNDAGFLLVLAGLMPVTFTSAIGLVLSGFAVGYLLRLLDARLSYEADPLPLGLVVLMGLSAVGFIGPEGPSLSSAVVALFLALLLSQVSLRGRLAHFDQLELSPRALAESIKENRLVVRRGLGSPHDELLYDIDSPEADRPVRGPLLTILFLTACLEFARFRAAAWTDQVAPDEALEFGRSLEGVLKTLTYFGSEAYLLSENAGGYLLAIPLTLSLFPICLLGVLTSAGQYVAPISVLGRLATGRWFLPGYDMIWAGPLLSVMVCAITSLSICATGVSFVIAGGVGLAAATYALQKLTPTGNRWRLTGHHRIVCGPVSTLRKRST